MNEPKIKEKETDTNDLIVNLVKALTDRMVDKEHKMTTLEIDLQKKEEQLEEKERQIKDLTTDSDNWKARAGKFKNWVIYTLGGAVTMTITITLIMRYVVH